MNLWVRKDFEAFLAYQHREEEKYLYPLITDYLDKKYGIQVYKITHWSGETQSGFNIVLSSNADFKKLKKRETYDEWRLHYPADGKSIGEIIQQQGLNESFGTENLKLSFHSFELYALEYCYGSAYKDIIAYQTKILNPATMERIINPGLLVQYKTKEMLKGAATSGEQDRIRKEYYEVVKKHDTYNLITPEKHLVLRFDCRPYHYLEWDEIRAGILSAE